MKSIYFPVELDRTKISNRIAKNFKLAICLFSVFLTLTTEFAVAVTPRPQDDFFHNANDAWQSRVDPEKRLCSDDAEADIYIKNKVMNGCDSDVVQSMYSSLSVSNDIKKRAMKYWLDKITNMNPAQIPELVALLRKIGVITFMDIGVTIDSNGNIIPEIILAKSSSRLDRVNAIKSYDPTQLEALRDGIKNEFQAAGEQPLSPDQLDDIRSILLKIDSLQKSNENNEIDFKLADLLDKNGPNGGWDGYLTTLLPKRPKMDISVHADNRVYMFELNHIITTFPAVKNYLKLRFLETYGELLGPPRYEQLASIFGNDLNRLCFEKYIKSNQGKFNEIVSNLVASYDDEITRSTVWDEKTKPWAKAKLHAISYLYEDGSGGIDYSKLKIDNENPVNNLMHIKQLQYQYMYDMFGKTQDPKEFKLRQDTKLWKMGLVHRVRSGKVIIPLPYMVPPHFYPNIEDAISYGGFTVNEDAINYGSFGTYIGHEIYHAFDVNNIKYNEHGVEGDWITNREKELFFGTNYKALSDQYKAYHDANTVVEDAADILGIKMAYNAYQRALIGKPTPAIVNRTEHNMQISQTTGNQRFYYAFAEMWRSSMCVITTHSPNEVRVQGPLKNQPGFRDAFNVKPGDGMYIVNPVSVW